MSSVPTESQPVISSSKKKAKFSATTKSKKERDNDIRTRPLLQEVDECLAQSLLVFLLADMRLMSATGRIGTKFETMAIDSDILPRDSADRLAGTETSVASQNLGLSPAQIMAILLVELQRTVEARRRAMPRELTESTAFNPSRHNIDNHDTFDRFSTALKRSRRFEDDMHDLLKAYAQMIGQDMNTDVPHITARRSVYRLAVELDESSDEEEDDEDKGLDMVALENIRQQVNRRTSLVTDKLVRANPVTGSALQRNNPIRIPKTEAQRDNEKFEEVTDVFFKMGDNPRVQSALLSSGVQTPALLEASAQTGDSAEVSLTAKDMLQIMETAAASRIYGKLDFMAKFFRDGTVSQLLAKSEVKIVWMNDWYPIKDLTYCIAVDEEKKRIEVIFRGAITRTDWSHAMDADLRAVRNPIREHYDGKTNLVELYSGFYQYLFRVRMDTKTRKYDEIANIAHKYGMERIGEDYQLMVTGHSLGAALSAVFSFYASADERFTRNGPVRVLTFGGPYVGGRKFARAFRHQESAGKVRFARFYNHNDIVAHLPINMNIGGKYEHVGIGIKLPRVPKYCASVRKWRPHVFYTGEETYCNRYSRAISNNVLLHMPLPWRIAKMHTLDQLQKRLMYGSAIKAKAGQFYLLEKPLDELYDILMDGKPASSSKSGAAASTTTVPKDEAKSENV